MPKMKTRRSAKKRFRLTGTGKVRFQRAGLRHNLENMTGAEKSHTAQEGTLAPGQARTALRMLGKR